MKKTIALFVLLLYLVALVPLALADRGSDDNSGRGSESDDDSDDNSTNSTDDHDDSDDEDDQDDVDDDDSDDNLTSESKGPGNGRGKPLRVQIAQEQRERARENFEKAKEEFKRVKKEYQERKLDLVRLKQEVKEACKEDSESEACKQKQNETLEEAKAFLTQATQAMIEHLNKIKSRVESSEHITEEKKAEISAKIDAEIAYLEGIILDIEAAQTKEELKAIADKLQNKWKSLKYKAQIFAGFVIESTMQKAVNRVSNQSAKLNCTIDALKEEGKDTTVLESLVDEFNGDLTAAQDRINSADDFLVKAHEIASKPELTQDDLDAIHANLEKAHALLKAAHEDLRQAHKTLQQIVKEVRELGGSIKDCSADDPFDGINASVNVTAEASA